MSGPAADAAGVALWGVLPCAFAGGGGCARPRAPRKHDHTTPPPHPHTRTPAPPHTQAHARMSARPHTHNHTPARPHARTDARTHARTPTRTHRRTDARTHGRTDARTHVGGMAAAVAVAKGGTERHGVNANANVRCDALHPRLVGRGPERLGGAGEDLGRVIPIEDDPRGLVAGGRDLMPSGSSVPSRRGARCYDVARCGREQLGQDPLKGPLKGPLPLPSRATHAKGFAAATAKQGQAACRVAS